MDRNNPEDRGSTDHDEANRSGSLERTLTRREGLKLGGASAVGLLGGSGLLGTTAGAVPDSPNAYSAVSLQSGDNPLEKADKPVALRRGNCVATGATYGQRRIYWNYKDAALIYRGALWNGSAWEHKFQLVNSSIAIKQKHRDIHNGEPDGQHLHDAEWEQQFEITPHDSPELNFQPHNDGESVGMISGDDYGPELYDMLDQQGIDPKDYAIDLIGTELDASEPFEQRYDEVDSIKREKDGEPISGGDAVDLLLIGLSMTVAAAGGGKAASAGVSLLSLLDTVVGSLEDGDPPEAYNPPHGVSSDGAQYAGEGVASGHVVTFDVEAEPEETGSFSIESSSTMINLDGARDDHLRATHEWRVDLEALPEPEETSEREWVPGGLNVHEYGPDPSKNGLSEYSPLDLEQAHYGTSVGLYDDDILLEDWAWVKEPKSEPDPEFVWPDLDETHTADEDLPISPVHHEAASPKHIDTQIWVYDPQGEAYPNTPAKINYEPYDADDLERHPRATIEADNLDSGTLLVGLIAVNEEGLTGGSAIGLTIEPGDG